MICKRCHKSYELQLFIRKDKTESPWCKFCREKYASQWRKEKAPEKYHSGAAEVDLPAPEPLKRLVQLCTQMGAQKYKALMMPKSATLAIKKTWRVYYALEGLANAELRKVASMLEE